MLEYTLAATIAVAALIDVIARGTLKPPLTAIIIALWVMYGWGVAAPLFRNLITTGATHGY